MKFIPITYQPEMVSASLADLKTQTRRKINPQPSETRANGKDVINVSDYFTGCPEKGKAYYWKHNGVWNSSKPFKCKYNVEDILWVRETWCLTTPFGPDDYYFGYKADGHYSEIKASEKYFYKSSCIYFPSIHMPAEACRLWQRVKSVRVERLQDISEDDAIAEGIEYKRFENQGLGYKVYGCGTERQMTAYPFVSFQSLWQSINGEQSWNDNPWVWVIEFENIHTAPDGWAEYLKEVQSKRK